MRGHLLPPTAESISMNKLLLLPTIQNEKEERTSRLYDSKSEQKRLLVKFLLKFSNIASILIGAFHFFLIVKISLHKECNFKLRELSLGCNSI